MKLYKYATLCLAIVLGACQTDKEVVEPDFQVRPVNQEFRVGEEVQFDISGKADIVTFFSGEQGNDYAYNETPRIDKIEEISLSFQTHNQESAPLPVVSLAEFRVMFSTDFNGTYDYASVVAATWTDITNRFTLGSPSLWGSDQGWYNSGVSDLSDLKEEGKNFYIAFKYNLPPYEGTTNQTRRWRVRSLNLSSRTSLGNVQVLGTYSPTNFSLISRDEPRTTTSQLANSILLFAPRGARAPESVEEWGVSKAFSADEINLGYEHGVAVKGIGDPSIKEFRHIYSKAGTYKVTFIATNANIHDTKRVVRQFDITIVPE